jgi:L-aminopeptidase/D-esterase-like protein
VANAPARRCGRGDRGLDREPGVAGGRGLDAGAASGRNDGIGGGCGASGDGYRGGISSASEEQSRGIEQVYIAVNQMDKSTQQNTAMVEEAAAAAAQSLREQTQALREAVDVFHVGRGGVGQRRCRATWLVIVAARLLATGHSAAGR